MRREFSKAVKRDAAKRCEGKCEECGIRLRSGGFHYDHVNPDYFGGEPTLENCQVLCLRCHDIKTGQKDIPDIARSKRIWDKDHGIQNDGRKIPYRLFDGTPVDPNRR
jgi:5-methylcytosine-specific restriction protein A